MTSATDISIKRIGDLTEQERQQFVQHGGYLVHTTTVSSSQENESTAACIGGVSADDSAYVGVVQDGVGNVLSTGIISQELGNMLGTLSVGRNTQAAERIAVLDPLLPDPEISDEEFRTASIRTTIYLEHGVKSAATPVKAENVAGDRGGLTKYGIDAQAHPGVDITNLTYDGATKIYATGEWPNSHADVLPRIWAFMVFDFYTTSGTNAWRCLQRATSDFIPSTFTGKRWDDGVFGSNTLKAAMASMDASVPLPKRLSVLNDFTTRRVKFYNDIVANDPSQKKFLDGWNKRAIHSMGYALALLKTTNVL